MAKSPLLLAFFHIECLEKLAQTQEFNTFLIGKKHKKKAGAVSCAPAFFLCFFLILSFGIICQAASAPAGALLAKAVHYLAGLTLNSDDRN